jgi:hypothetical protein
MKHCMHERLMKLVCNLFYIDLIAPEGLEGNTMCLVVLKLQRAIFLNMSL